MYLLGRSDILLRPTPWSTKLLVMTLTIELTQDELESLFAELNPTITTEGVEVTPRPSSTPPPIGLPVSAHDRKFASQLDRLFAVGAR